MTTHVDHAPDGRPLGRCVVLPGSRYSPDAPLLFFATQVALARGWEVRQVWWEPPQHASDADEVAWVGDQLDAAVDGYDGPVVVVAKSLGTLAAARAAERGYPAAWLTPLLTEDDVAGPLRTFPAPQLVVIGTEDPYLDRDVLDALPGDSLVVAGDHVLRVPGDPVAMAAGHAAVMEALDDWWSRLQATPA